MVTFSNHGKRFVFLAWLKAWQQLDKPRRKCPTHREGDRVDKGMAEEGVKEERNRVRGVSSKREEKEKDRASETSRRGRRVSC